MYQRHDLLLPSSQAAQQVFQLWQATNPQRQVSPLTDWQCALISGHIPGIVRRPLPTEPLGDIALGFSFPLRIDGRRQRLATTLSVADVLQRITPFEVAAMAFTASSPVLYALAELRERFRSLACIPGVWGSVAQQIVTGLPYTDAASDLDILIEVCPAEQLRSVHQCVLLLEQQHGLRIDVEVRLAHGYGVNLKELMSSAQQVLGKSLNDVRLFERAILLRA